MSKAAKNQLCDADSH